MAEQRDGHGGHYVNWPGTELDRCLVLVPVADLPNRALPGDSGGNHCTPTLPARAPLLKGDLSP